MSDTGVCSTIRQTLQRELRLAGVDDNQASIIIQNVEKSIRTEHGGIQTYVPSDSSLEKKERNTAIIKDWKNGERNRIKLSRRYGVNKSTVTRIINQYLSEQSRNSTRSDWNL